MEEKGQVVRSPKKDILQQIQDMYSRKHKVCLIVFSSLIR